MKRFTKRGFTTIELLIVVGIVGLLSTILLINVNSARVRARDVQRVADIKFIQTQLALYKDKNGKYPLSPLKSGGSVRIWSSTILGIPASQLPVAPQPPDGDCIGAENKYMYRSLDGSSYGLTFCIGRDSAQYRAGYSFAYKDWSSLRYDMDGDGAIEFDPLNPSDPTNDPKVIGKCEANVAGAQCVSAEFLDINQTGIVSSTDAGCLQNVIISVLAGNHPEPTDPTFCLQN